MNRRFLFLASVAVVFLSSLPYIFGRFTTPDHLFFTDRDFIVAADKAVYISMIEEARQGHVLFSNLFTGEEQTPRLVAPIWFVLGNIARTTHLSSIDAYEVGRIGAGIAFLFFLGSIVSFFFTSLRERWGAFTLLALSSGVGAWVLPSSRTGFSSAEIFWKLPTDLWISESNTFLTLSHSALFILAQGLLVFVFVFWYRWTTYRRIGDFGALLCATLLLGFIHPYDILLTLTVLTASVIATMLLLPSYTPKALRQDLWGIVAVGILGAVPLLFFLFTMGNEAALAGWMVQNVTPSPPFSRYLLGFGALVPAALLGGMLAWKTRDRRWIIPIAWVVATMFLLYAPVQFQRRFVNGLHLPLALLAAYGCCSVWSALQHRLVWRVVFFWGGVLLFFGTTFYVIGQQTFFVYEQRAPIVVDHAVANAAFWLRDRTGMDAVVLANGTYGNLLPALTGRRVWFGHGHQTVSMREKRNLLSQWFFATNNDAGKKFFLENEGITHLFFVADDPYTSDFSPEGKEYLTEIFREGRVSVYTVR